MTNLFSTLLRGFFSRVLRYYLIDYTKCGRIFLFSFKFDALKSGISLKQLRHVVRGLDMLNKNEEASSTDPFGLLDVEPNSKSLGIKRRVPSISISFKYIY